MGGGYGCSLEYHPMTVRIWLDDAFVSSIGPVAPGVASEVSVLEMLAVSNDLVYVDDSAPRCSVWIVT